MLPLHPLAPAAALVWIGSPRSPSLLSPWPRSLTSPRSRSLRFSPQSTGNPSHVFAASCRRSEPPQTNRGHLNLRLDVLCLLADVRKPGRPQSSGIAVFVSVTVPSPRGHHRQFPHRRSPSDLAEHSSVFRVSTRICSTSSLSPPCSVTTPRSTASIRCRRVAIAAVVAGPRRLLLCRQVAAPPSLGRRRSPHRWRHSQRPSSPHRAGRHVASVRAPRNTRACSSVQTDRITEKR